MKNKAAQKTLYRALAAAGIVASMMACLPAYADEVADVGKLAKAGKVVEALGKANEYLAKHPSDPQMRFMKGVLLTEQNKSDEAIAVFTKLTEDYKDLPEPYNNLAVLYAANGQYDKARTALEKAIRTNPSYMTAYENLGDVYGKMASQAYDKALALGANNAPPAKSKLTLLRNFSSSTGPKTSLPDAAAAPQVAQASATPARTAAATGAPPLISQIPQDAGKSNAPQRIPALSVSPPPPAPPVKIAAAPVPAPVPTPTPVPVKPAAPAPAPVIAKVEPPKPTPVPPPVPAPAPTVVLAKAEPAKTKPAPAPTPAPVAAAPAPAPAKPAPVVAQVEPPKPVKAEPEKPKPEKAKPDTSERDAVLAQVHGWAKAWTSQNVDSYLGYYSQQFEPPKGLSRKAWADERRARIEGKGRISVEVGGPEVVINGDTAKVTFRQTYESDRLTARSRKTLVLIKNGGKWQIKQESSGS
jgi:colicin import membrane protein